MSNLISGIINAGSGDAYEKGLDMAQKQRLAPLVERKALADTRGSEMKAASEKLEQITSLLNGVKDQQTYQQAAGILHNAGVIDANELPPQYDPQYVELHKNSLLSTKSKIEQAYKLQQINESKAGGSTGVLLDRLNNEPGLKDALLTKTNANKGMVVNPLTGKMELASGYNESISSTEGAKKKEEKRAEVDVQREANKTKAESALRGFEQQAGLVTKNIDDAIGSINPYSTGYGSLLSSLPNTDARKLNNYLNTIKANVGFDKLQSMRENSPTGGALGQVSDMENKLLQAVNGALDAGQADQLKDNLQVIKSLYPQVMEERKRAFQQDYGGYAPAGNNPQGMTPAEKTASMLPPEESPKTVLPAPKLGTLRNGYIFNGGDPSKETSWKKANK